MFKMITTISATILLNISLAQVPQFSKYDIGLTGCKAYFPSPPEFEMSLSEDSSFVYTAEVNFENFNYAVICVVFKESLNNNQEENISLLESYMDYLQAQYKITEAAGYGEGHTMESNPQAAGVIDFWADAESNNWNVKGWVDSDILAVMLIYGPGEIDYNVSQLFLNGFRFPEY